MRLRKIIVAGADGLKGQTFEQPLSGCDIFVGPNGSGKSTRLAAVMAGLRGLATTPTDAEREYLGPELPAATVTLEFDNGRAVARDLSVGRGKAADLASALADEIAGPHLVRWDLGDFVRGTDAARTKLLDRVGSASTWTRERAVAWLRDHLSLAEGQAHEIDRLTKPSKAATVDAWLVGAIEAAREAFTTANAAAKQSTMAADVQAAERRNRPPAADLGEARARLATAEREAGELRALVAGAQQSSAVATAHHARGEALVRDVARLTDELAAAERALAESRIALDDIRRREVMAPGTSGDLMAHASKLVDGARAKAAQTAAAAAELRGRLSGLEAHAPSDGRDEVCQHCAGVDPLDRAAGASAHRDAVAALRAELDDAESAASLSAMAARRAEKAHTEAVAMVNAQAQARRAWEDAERRTLSDEAASAGKVAARKTALTEAEARLTAHVSEPAPQLQDVDETTAARADAADEALATARREVEEAVRQQEREGAFQRAIAAREEAKTKLAEVKEAGKALKALRELIVVETFGPLEERANELLVSAGSDLRAKFVDAATYGATRGATFIHFAALSDAERALVGASVAYALTASASAPWRAVILDRMEVIDDARIGDVVRAFERMVEGGALHNFLGAYTSTETVADLGDSQRWLGGEA